MVDDTLTVIFKPEHAARIRAAFGDRPVDKVVKGIVMSRVDRKEKQGEGEISCGVTFRGDNAKRIEELFGPMSSGSRRYFLGQLVHHNFMGFLAYLANAPAMAAIITEALSEKDEQ